MTARLVLRFEEAQKGKEDSLTDGNKGNEGVADQIRGTV